jgi:hypothetical protein
MTLSEEMSYFDAGLLIPFLLIVHLRPSVI